MNSAVLGHSDIRKKLLRLFAQGRLAHSNLFSGPRGIGKRLVALELAKFALCEVQSKTEGSCNDCAACGIFEAGNHPDFHLFEREKDGLSAEQTRIFLNSINLAPYRGGKRVVIFNDAGSLSAVVANLLLKTLEEPRKDSIFILIAANPSRLPLPVVSRCQQWRFNFLESEELKQIISNLAEPAEAAYLVELCDGSLEQINSLREWQKGSRQLKESLKKILAGDNLEALALASALAKDKANLGIKLGLIRTFLKSLLFSENNPGKKLALADALENIITADRLTRERNFAALSLLNISFLGLCGKIDFQSGTLSEIVV